MKWFKAKRREDKRAAKQVLEEALESLMLPIRITQTTKGKWSIWKNRLSLTPNHVQTHGIGGSLPSPIKKTERLLVIFQIKSTFSITNSQGSIPSHKLNFQKMWETKTTIINRNLLWQRKNSKTCSIQGRNHQAVDVWISQECAQCLNRVGFTPTTPPTSRAK